jgi:hypothetical protein
MTEALRENHTLGVKFDRFPSYRFRIVRFSQQIGLAFSMLKIKA